MGARSAAASVVRHVGGVAVEATLVAALVATVALAFSPVYAPAKFLAGTEKTLAATSKGGSWIALSQVNGAAAAAVQPSLGSAVAFDTSYPSSVKNPRIEVLCYQSGSLVYGEAGAVTDSFLLGGGGSIWLTNGGAADCTANLFYFGMHAGSQTYNLLATTSFNAGG